MNQQCDRRRQGGAALVWILLVVVLLLLAAGGYWYWQQQLARQQPEAPATSEVVPVSPPPLAAAPSTPAIEHPLPAAESQAPDAPELPPLAQSDGPAREALSGVIGGKFFSDWLQGSDLLKRLVVTVDNLPRESMPMSLRVVRPVPGALVTNRDGDEAILAPGNYARYTPLLKLAQAVDPHRLAEAYIRFYPLFQQQYRELGYPDAYFNDALVRAIDDLLRTPEIREPIRLVQPKVFFQYEDPSLEKRSIGQKMMLRMGPDNIQLAKQILRSFRKEITGRAPKP